MSWTKTATIVVIIVTTVLVVAWDIYVAVEPTPRDTISKVLLDATRQHPSMAIMIGILLGHLMWPMQIYAELAYWKISLPIASVVWLVFLVLDLTIRLPVSEATPMEYFVAGFYMGHFLWPQQAL